MLNKVLLIGRLTGDPVIRYLPSGSPFTEFNIAWNRRYRVGEEWRDESHFFDIKAYGKLAEDLSTRLSKGYMVVVEGRLAQERWTDQEGRNRSRIRVIAESVRIIRKPKIEEEIEEDVLPSEDRDIERIEEELRSSLGEEKPFDDEDEIPF